MSKQYFKQVFNWFYRSSLYSSVASEHAEANLVPNFIQNAGTRDYSLRKFKKVSARPNNNESEGSLDEISQKYFNKQVSDVSPVSHNFSKNKEEVKHESQGEPNVVLPSKPEKKTSKPRKVSKDYKQSESHPIFVQTLSKVSIIYLKYLLSER